MRLISVSLGFHFIRSWSGVDELAYVIVRCLTECVGKLSAPLGRRIKHSSNDEVVHRGISLGHPKVIVE